jgi:CAAX protease family protein
VIGYVFMPLITIALMPRERIRDYHFSLAGFTKHLWIYVLLFTLITPAVMVASTTQSFRHTYPFYRLANRSHFDLWTWEAFYAAQFVSLEIFFRGFLLHGLRRAFGANAIFVMIVPYCMIHYGKPLPETLGAIGAGVILGTVAMRTKSIWGGVLIHIGVAMTMDILALRGCPPFGSNRFCGG